jgi:DNA recombination protein RmuC
LVLDRVLQLSGLEKDIHYRRQVTVEGEGGNKLRPDVIVNLPDGLSVVIDSKASMKAYLEAHECKDEPQRDICLDRFAAHIQENVRRLASKAYTDFVVNECGHTADFTVLFIPGEWFLYAAVARKSDMIERALEQKIAISTPTMLTALLRVVAQGWRKAKVVENAEAIRELGLQLHERLCIFAEHFGGLSAALQNAFTCYDAAVGSWNQNLVSTIKKLEAADAKSPKKTPGELSIIDAEMRSLRALPPVPAEDSA